MKVIDRIALVLAIIGGLNWGCVGIFGLDIVAALFGGSASGVSRLVYVLVCLSAIWCITLFFRRTLWSGRPEGMRNILFFALFLGGISISPQEREDARQQTEPQPKKAAAPLLGGKGRRVLFSEIRRPWVYLALFL